MDYRLSRLFYHQGKIPCFQAKQSNTTTLEKLQTIIVIILKELCISKTTEEVKYSFRKSNKNETHVELKSRVVTLVYLELILT